MLTVKHTGEGGRETLEAVVSVTYDPDTNELTGLRGDLEPLRYSTGYAYVMNEHGKTVGVYNLMRSRKKK